MFSPESVTALNEIASTWFYVNCQSQTTFSGNYAFPRENKENKFCDHSDVHHSHEHSGTSENVFQTIPEERERERDRFAPV